MTSQSSTPRIYFLHIPKTAGTTISSFIRSAYAEGEIFPAYHCEQLSSFTLTDLRRFQCYSGHFGTVLHSILGNDFPTVTILRDPFERAVSQYFHALRLTDPITWRLYTQAGSWLWERIEVKPLKQWLERRLMQPLLRDWQTRMLGTELNHCWFRDMRAPNIGLILERRGKYQPMDTILESAKARLEQMPIIGFSEDIDVMVASLAQYLQIARPIKTPFLNKAPNRSFHQLYRDSNLVPPKIAQLADELNGYDRQLYQYARQLAVRRALQSDVDKRAGTATLQAPNFPSWSAIYTACHS